jgi:hypothetical protein
MNQTTTLYEQDFYAWIQHHITLLRQRRLAEIDVDILIDELESMAKRDRHELVSHLIILIAHLLKWQFQFKQLADMWKEFAEKSWQHTLLEQRLQITRQLELSPSLKPYLPEAVNQAYPLAVNLTVKETHLPKSTFSELCPYTVAQLLDDEFYPDKV